MLDYLYDYQNKMVESDWFHFLVGNVVLPDKSDFHNSMMRSILLLGKLLMFI